MEREHERFFPAAGLAMLIGTVLGPPFLLSASEPGETGLAIAPVAIAAAATLAIVLAVHRAVSPPAIGALLIGPAIATLVVARGATDRPVACAAAGLPYDAPTPVLALIAAVLLAGLGARIAELVQRDERVHRWARLGAAAITIGALALHLVALARRDAPSPAERLARFTPTATLGVMIDDGEQVARVAPWIEVRRSCGAGLCELVVHLDDHEGYEGGSRRPLGDETDRVPLAIVPLPEAIAVVPRTAGGDLDWSRAMAFRSRTAHHDDIGPLELGGAVAAPASWRLASWIGLAIACMACVLAIGARRRRARIESGTEAHVDPDGVVRLDRGGAMRPRRALAPGPIVILRRAPGHPSYRDEGLPTAVDAIEGTRAEWMDRLSDRALGLELAAIGTILLTHAALLSAWLAGYAVLGS